MNIVLCGYHWSGCKALDLLLNDGHNVYVYTHEAVNCVPDLESLCIKYKVPYSTEKIDISNLPFIPDIVCSIYYRYIINEEVIALVKGKIFNLHPALLPKYRGCSSLTWAMINGEKECGFTYHYIDIGCDTGDVILQKVIKITDYDTQLSLYYRVMFEAMEYFIEAFKAVANGAEGIPQIGESSYYKRGCPLGGLIEEGCANEKADRIIRAMIFPPYPPAVYQDENIYTYKEYLKKINDSR